MTYTLVNRDKKSSVYNKVAELLLKNEGNWKCCSRNSPSFHLMLGDRNNLPYHTLGLRPGVQQLVNYYRGSSELCKKVSCVRLLTSYRRQFSLEDYDWLPESYIIVPSCVQASSKVKDDRERLIENYGDTRTNVWIAKMSSGAKGLGILLSRDVQELIHRVDQQDQSHIIQSYVEQPLLLPGRRKFDIRVWVVLDHEYNIFMYKEGVLRTCSEEYDIEDLSKLTSHLSNHCLQEEQSSNYGRYESNNEVFFSQFASVLAEISGGKCSLDVNLIPQMERIIIQCFDAIQDRISADGLAYRCFQLFGFDFLVDEVYKVYLLEINGAPASSQDLLDDMAEALIQLCIDPLFPNFQEKSSRKQLFKLIRRRRSEVSSQY